MSAAERLVQAEDRLQELEAECRRLRELARGLVASVEHLAILAGASPAAASAPARAALHVLQGGAS